MDWTELRRASRHEAEGGEPDDVRLAAMKAPLEQRMRMAGSAVRRGSRRRTAVPALGLVLVTALAVVFAVAAGPAPRASADVSRTLQAAATALSASERASASTTVVYRRLVTDGTASLLVGGVYLQRPVGSGEVWERVYRPERTLAGWGPSTNALLDGDPDPDAAGTTTVRSDETDGFWDRWGADFTPAAVRALPRTPEELLKTLQGSSTDPERGLDQAGALLDSGLADPDLQAAVYRALERIPGLELTPRVEDVDGRSGVGIGMPVSGGLQRLELIIDPASGRYLGRTETNVGAADAAPAGTVVLGTALHRG